MFLKESQFCFNRTRGNKDGKVCLATALHINTHCRYPNASQTEERLGDRPFCFFNFRPFDLVSLECKDCYCLYHREFKRPATSAARPRLKSALCTSSLVGKTWEATFCLQIVIFTLCCKMERCCAVKSW